MSQPTDNPLAPHALQTAIAAMVERLLIEASYPVLSGSIKRDKRQLAREQLAALIGNLTIADLPDDTVHIKAFHGFRKAPQQAKIWGGYTRVESGNGEYVISVNVLETDR